MPNNPITPTNEARTNGTVIDASHTNDLASALNRLVGITSTASSAGTLTLVVGSMRTQQITGTTTHTVVMPVVSTLGLGFPFKIINDSTGIVTVNSSGGNLIYAIPAGVTVDFICILLTGTTAASWLADYPASAASSGLTLIRRASFSAVSNTGTTFDGVFTSAYKSYLIIVENLFGSSVGANSQLQFRAAAATLVANTYVSQSFGYKPDSTLTTLAVNPSTLMPLSVMGTDMESASGMELTAYQVGNSSQRARVAGTLFDGYTPAPRAFGGYYTTNATVDGIIFSASAGTITGAVSIYGLAI